MNILHGVRGSGRTRRAGLAAVVLGSSIALGSVATMVGCESALVGAAIAYNGEVQAQGRRDAARIQNRGYDPQNAVRTAPPIALQREAPIPRWVDGSPLAHYEFNQFAVDSPETHTTPYCADISIYPEGVFIERYQKAKGLMGWDAMPYKGIASVESDKAHGLGKLNGNADRLYILFRSGKTYSFGTSGRDRLDVNAVEQYIEQQMREGEKITAPLNTK